MSKLNQLIILDAVVPLFADQGITGFSIRKLAKRLSASPSVIYYHFQNEEVLLRAMFDEINHRLGQHRALLPQLETASDTLKQRINFQLDHQQEIVAVLKYYLSFRATFPKFKNGFVPDKSALHIEEVLRLGMQTGEFVIDDLEDDAKVITHAINGFLLEYHPYIPTGQERQSLVNRIHSFLIRALTQ